MVGAPTWPDDGAPRVAHRHGRARRARGSVSGRIVPPNRHAHFQRRAPLGVGEPRAAAARGRSGPARPRTATKNRLRRRGPPLSAAPPPPTTLPSIHPTTPPWWIARGSLAPDSRNTSRREDLNRQLHARVRFVPGQVLVRDSTPHMTGRHPLRRGRYQRSSPTPVRGNGNDRPHAHTAEG